MAGDMERILSAGNTVIAPGAKFGDSTRTSGARKANKKVAGDSQRDSVYHVHRANSTTPCGASMLETLGTPTAAPESTSSVSPWSASSMYLNSPAARTVQLYFWINSSTSMSITSLTWKPKKSDTSDRGP